MKTFRGVEHGSDLGQWTRTIWTNICSPDPRRLNMKYIYNLHRVFEEKSFKTVDDWQIRDERLSPQSFAKKCQSHLNESALKHVTVKYPCVWKQSVHQVPSKRISYLKIVEFLQCLEGANSFLSEYSLTVQVSKKPFLTVVSPASVSLPLMPLCMLNYLCLYSHTYSSVSIHWSISAQTISGHPQKLWLPHKHYNVSCSHIYLLKSWPYWSCVLG